MSGIFVGYSDRVDGAVFYCPHTKRTYETADYKMAPTGAFFRLPYGKTNFADNFTKEQKCNATFTSSRDSYMCSLADGGCWKVSIPNSNSE